MKGTERLKELSERSHFVASNLSSLVRGSIATAMIKSGLGLTSTEVRNE